MLETISIILLPFVGTVLGASCVFFTRSTLSRGVEAALSGLSAGVMMAASVFGLLLPAIEASSQWGFFASIPPLIGLFCGFFFLLLANRFADRLFLSSKKGRDVSDKKRSVFLLVLAVTVHNLPEGMAVGASLAGLLTKDAGVTFAGIFALSLGIAIQNFPEGAIVSLPLRASGQKKGRACLFGMLSGAVEPISACLTLFAARFVQPFMPYLLGFAAGAMLSVVLTELIPHTEGRRENTLGVLFFACGFALMTFLDVALG